MKSLQDFQQKSDESFSEAYYRMRRLIMAKGDVIEAQSVQFWYAMVSSKLKNRVRIAILLKLETPTLNVVFELAELMELNMNIRSTFETKSKTYIPFHSIFNKHFWIMLWKNVFRYLRSLFFQKDVVWEKKASFSTIYSYRLRQIPQHSMLSNLEKQITLKKMGNSWDFKLQKRKSGTERNEPPTLYYIPFQEIFWSKT